MKKVLFCFLALFLGLGILFAENFTIEQYDIDINVGENRVYTINERLLLNFTTPSHGFYRSIPYKYNGDVAVKARVNDIEVSSQWEKENEGDYISLKIGDEDTLVSGLQEYYISYTYDLGEDLYPDYDEFYYNIIGDGWSTSIRNVKFNVTFPKQIDSNRIWMTSGSYGSIGFNGNITFDGTTTVSGYVASLNPNDALTLRVEMDDGYFVGAREIKDFSIPAGVVAILIAILIILYFILTYFKYGVDKPLAVVVNYSAPDGLTPLECGYIVDEKADDKDIGAMIFYWADKGYLTIEEQDAKNDSFIFHKKRELDEKATDNEKELFAALFKSGDDVDIGDLESSQFAKAVIEDIKPSIGSYFKGERQLIEQKSKNKAITTTFLAFLFSIVYSFCMSVYDMEYLFVVLFCTVFFVILSLCFAAVMRKYRYINKSIRFAYLLVYLIFALVLASLTLIFSLSGNSSTITTMVAFICFATIGILGSFGALVMEKRSDYGQHTLENVLGFREYIDKVEVDKLKLLIDQDPEYFYHVLSYAICFGLEDRWARKFKDIFVAPASWYYSPYNTVTDYFFYAALYRRWNNAYKSQIVPASYPQSTSGHGGASTFSGSSGFSGGGFGGGGGRSW